MTMNNLINGSTFGLRKIYLLIVIFGYGKLYAESIEQSLVNPKIIYKQKVASSTEAVELGERTTVDAALEYQSTPQTILGMRIDTDPEKNEYDNETSILEATAVHSYKLFKFAIDLDINLDARHHGGTSFGLDSDSMMSYLEWNFASGFYLDLHPYNFGGKVGKQFITDDITRIYYIEGTPSYINYQPLSKEHIRMKTIPGLVLNYKSKALNAYFGSGAASYEYPANRDFDIRKQTKAERWQVENDTSIKAGFGWQIGEQDYVKFEYVSHDQAAKTGALLAKANSVQYSHNDKQGLSIDLERGETKAGLAPIQLSRDYSWFEQRAPFYPVYADYYGKPQSWIDQTGTAYSIKVGYHRDQSLPYFGIRNLSKNFIFRDRDSVQRLRTADESASHGGLTIYALGIDWREGPLSLRPEIELKRASNRVFGNTRDLREDRFLRKLVYNENALTLYATYGL